MVAAHQHKELSHMTTISPNPSPVEPEKKASLGERVDVVVDKAQVKLDAVVDAAQAKAHSTAEQIAAKRDEASDKAKGHAVDALDATQATVDNAVGKAKDALQK
jgi:hypothetical protein